MAKKVYQDESPGFSMSGIEAGVMIPEDIRLVMNGWVEKRTQLALIGELLGFAFTLRCWVNHLTETAVELSTTDGGRMIVDLSDPSMQFRYAEPREFTELEVTKEQGLASSVMVLAWRSGERESLYFCEVIE